MENPDKLPKPENKAPAEEAKPKESIDNKTAREISDTDDTPA